MCALLGKGSRANVGRRAHAGMVYMYLNSQWAIERLTRVCSFVMWGKLYDVATVTTFQSHIDV